jgi:hypothetical protein
MNDIVKKPDNYAARYEVADPYAAFAAEGGPGIVGKLLVCKKGDWTIGSEGDAVPAEARFLLLVDTMMRGWLKWHGGRVVEAEMGFVKDNFPVRHRYSLPDQDESQWEKLSDGKGRDPWAQSYRVLLIEVSPPHGDVTFSGSSQGTAIALREICRVYSAEAALHPGAFPVVKLTRKTRPHKQYGTIPGPWFTVEGWATVEDIRAGRKSQAAIAKPRKAKAKPVAAELNDELPDWGK